MNELIACCLANKCVNNRDLVATKPCKNENEIGPDLTVRYAKEHNNKANTANCCSDTSDFMDDDIVALEKALNSAYLMYTNMKSTQMQLLNGQCVCLYVEDQLEL